MYFIICYFIDLKSSNDCQPVIFLILGLEKVKDIKPTIKNDFVLLTWSESFNYEQCVEQYHLNFNSNHTIVNSKSFLITDLKPNTFYNCSIHVVHTNGKAGDTTNFSFTTHKICEFNFSNYSSFKYSSKIFQPFKCIKFVHPLFS